MSYETLLEWMMILGGINIVLCGLMLAFGFRRPKPVELQVSLGKG